MDDLTQRTYKSFGTGTVYDLPLNDPYRKKGGTVYLHSILHVTVDSNIPVSGCTTTTGMHKRP